MFRTSRWMRLIGLMAVLILVSGTGNMAVAVDANRVEEAIQKGKQFLLSRPKTAAAGSLACYALVKAGVEKDHPDVQKCVQEIKVKCRSSNYIPIEHHNYEAGVDAMLLEAVDRETYKPQLDAIAKFLMARQRPHGGWYYPSEFGGGDYGDTSITQYAILGLWAAHRAEIEIPVTTWEKAAKWLIATQRREGGFGYHPGDPKTGNAGLDILPTMSVAGTGSLLVIRQVLFRDAEFADDIRPPVAVAASSKKFGVLERFVDDKEKKAAATPNLNATMSVATIDKAIKEGVGWNADHFAEPAAFATYGNYYLYGVERLGALLAVEKIGVHDWYDEGAEELLRRQANDGSWQDACGNVPATSLTLLFLSKATSSLINKAPKQRAVVIGGGLLVGGRGLPDNLDAVKVTDGELTKRKLHGPVDGLLAELEKSSGAKVEAAQAAVVEAVQLDNPEQLINQVDRLKRLSSDGRVEVRRTAMWALGRTGNVSVAPYLIKGIADADESVAREASVGLCILSRRPNGCGQPADPADAVPDDASDEQRAKYIDTWRKASTKGWTDWYLKVRPYDERDDRTQLKRKP